MFSNERELRQPVEGSMLKFTNVVKGWQYRWFLLDPERGSLDYYVEKPTSVAKVAPRGTMHLGGAVISPTDEDEQTFTVSPVDGEPYKLRTSVKDRQFWIQRLRAVAQMHTDAMAQVICSNSARAFSRAWWIPLFGDALWVKPLHVTLRSSSEKKTQTNPPLALREHRPASDSSYHQSRVKPPAADVGLSAMDALSTAHATLQQAALANHSFCHIVESLPPSAKRWKPTEPKLLLTKATSQAALAALQKCFEMLQTQHLHNSQVHQARGAAARGAKKPIFNVPRKPTRRSKPSVSTPKDVPSSASGHEVVAAASPDHVSS